MLSQFLNWNSIYISFKKGELLINLIHHLSLIVSLFLSLGPFQKGK